jgi:DNA-binding response OmpR family regulator
MSQILIVDDEERIAEIIEKFLKIHGFDVLKALGGEEAVSILSLDAQIDLMVLDLKMPRVSGLRVIEEKERVGKKFPVLLLTGSVDAEKYLTVLGDKGFAADDILYKPIDLSELLERIKKKLNID